MQSVQEVADQRPSNAFEPEAAMIDAKSFAGIIDVRYCVATAANRESFSQNYAKRCKSSIAFYISHL